MLSGAVAADVLSPVQHLAITGLRKYHRLPISYKVCYLLIVVVLAYTICTGIYLGRNPFLCVSG